MENQNIFWVNARALIERTRDGKKEIVVQQTTKDGRETWELPGGRIDMHESLYDALRREVKEETGLDVTKIIGEDGYFREGTVECLKPYCVYQYLEGFKGVVGNALGFYFICHATGNLLDEGDDTKNAKWVDLNELKRIIENEDFASSGKVSAIQYLKENQAHCHE